VIGLRSGLTLGLILASVGLLVAAVAAMFAHSLGPPSADSFQHGMVFGLFARDDPGHTDKGLIEMKALGVDSVSIVIPWVIADVRSSSMAPRGDMTPSDASLRYTIGRAHETGMRVFLMPILYVDKMEDDEWRGTITPADWKVWFDNYGAFILRYAALAQELGVEYLSIGSELCSTEARAQDWLDLIAGIRAVYRGRLTYSANWDHRGDLGFARELDFLGMNAYFELSQEDSPAESELVDAWKEIRAEVETWRSRYEKPLVITEVGYPSRPGAARNPWNYSAGGVPDLEIQLRCYRAFRSIWGSEGHLQGVYFYLWWDDGGPTDNGYTPRGKPAAAVIWQWFTK